jgi:hypothetical protein
MIRIVAVILTVLIVSAAQSEASPNSESSAAYLCGFIAAQDKILHDVAGEEPEEDAVCTRYREAVLATPGNTQTLWSLYKWATRHD